MLVLADELLENFFDHEFAQSFKLVEKPVEQQRSLGREIFDSLLATGTKFANNAKQKALVSSPLSSKASNVSSPTTTTSSDTQSLSTTSLSVNPKQDEKEDIDTTPQEPVQHDEEKKQEPTSSNSSNEEAVAASATVTESPKKEHAVADEKKKDDDEDSNDEDEDEDVLEEVDRLLKEYGDEDEDDEDEDAKST